MRPAAYHLLVVLAALAAAVVLSQRRRRARPRRSRQMPDSRQQQEQRAGAPCPPIEEVLLESRRRHPYGVVLVVGANVGEGFGALSVNPEAPEIWWNSTLFGSTYRKILVEPVPPIFAELQRRTGRPGWPENVTLVNAAVGDTAGETTIWCLSAVELFPDSLGQICSSDREKLVQNARAVMPAVETSAIGGKLKWADRQQLLRFVYEEGSRIAAGAPPAGAPLGVGAAQTATAGARRLLAVGHNRKHKKRKFAWGYGFNGTKIQLWNPADAKPRWPSAARSFRVRVTPVASMLAGLRIPLQSVRFVQIDTEGGDLAVLRTLPAEDQGFRPQVIQWEQNIMRARDRDSAHRLIMDRGYTLCPHGTGDLRSPTALQQCSDVVAFRRD
eukprot:TRINITY_DN5464_c0_g2_i2.p1 TRINITY_DN5464_c0_g2~~TRINITY_DN5464_c0_g2_i2.p1  ORF type:complete len:385 (+),score=44.84 TRINITY_DN5464_c0_g2_i2:82-1236(+)